MCHEIAVEEGLADDQNADGGRIPCQHRPRGFREDLRRGRCGKGACVTFDIKIAVHSRDVNDFAPVVNAVETRTAELSDEDHPTNSRPTIPNMAPTSKV